MTDGYLGFNEYIVASEPHKREGAEAWKVDSALKRQQTTNPLQRLGYKNGITYNRPAGV